MGTDKPRRLSPGYALTCLLCMLSAASATCGFAGPWLPAARRTPTAGMLAPADEPAIGSSPAAFSDPLMAAVSGKAYDAVMAFVIGFGLHACVPFGSLNGVLNGISGTGHVLGVLPGVSS